MNVEVISTITYHGERRYPGAQLSIAEPKVVTQLLKRGAIKRLGNQVVEAPDNPKSEDGESGSTDAAADSTSAIPNASSEAVGEGTGNGAGADTKLSLLDATAKLVTEKAEGTLTGGGKPKVEALEPLTGRTDISASERDAAFEEALTQGLIG